VAKQPPKQSANSKPDADNPKPTGYDKVMARWTAILGGSTIALFLATGVSAYFLYETDQTIKKQVEAAGIQLRAYINFQQLIYIPHFSADPHNPADPPPGANVGVTWKNFGSTPAREFEYWISAKWYPNGNEPDFSKPIELSSEKYNITLSPGAEIATAAVFVPMADIQKLAVKNGRVFLWGHATYRDYIPGSPVRHFHLCLYSEVLPAIGQAGFNVYKPDCNYSN
jgi:hypothetical protein